MKYTETPVLFECCGEPLVGVVAAPEDQQSTHRCGVLIIVGGPQYRIGSHRQFLLLSRRLAEAGYAVMRFDYRGMGDSGGALRSFESVDEDISAALNAFQQACPGVSQIALWGLCDAASAAILYWHRSGDARVAGLCLLNPWLRSEASLARTRVRHYYWQRLADLQFWLKLLSGGVRLFGSLRELMHNWRLSRGSADMATPYQQSMLTGLANFAGPILFVLSGRDYTAKEFVDHLMGSDEGRRILKRSSVRRVDLAEADHTFSSAVWRKEVEDATLAWLDDVVK